jgi:hypothetical protein
VRRLGSFAVLAGLITFGLAGAGDGAIAEQTPVPVGFAVFVPCAADGAGELVSLSGTLHVTTQTVQRSATQWVTTSHINPQGVVGIGEITGDTYRGTGHTGSTVVSATAGERITQTNSFRLVAPGPDNNLLAHTSWHMTTQADGSVVAQVDNVSLTCR